VLPALVKIRVIARAAITQRHSDWTDEEHIVHALNIHGTFFERHCESVVERDPDWQVVATNYPVHFPEPGDPQFQQGEMDLCVTYTDPAKVGVVLVIECKKNNPELVNWVFLRKRLPRVICVTALKATPGGGRWRPEPVNYGYQWGIWLADAGREVKGDFKTRDATRTSNDAITKACNQVALACRATFKNEYGRLGLEAAGGQSPEFDHLFFLPTVVTTANLLVMKFDPADVDPRTGEIPSGRGRLESVDYLFYEHPLPEAFQQHAAMTAAGLQHEWLVKQHMLIVQSEALPKVLSNLVHDREAFYGAGSLGVHGGKLLR
jgi:hypothetical protein